MSLNKRIKSSFETLSQFEQKAKKLIVDQVQKGVSKEKIAKSLLTMTTEVCKSLDSAIDKKQMLEGLLKSVKGWLLYYSAEYSKYRRRAIRIAKRLIMTKEGKKIALEVLEHHAGFTISSKIDDNNLMKIYQRYGQLEEQNKVHGFIGGRKYRKDLVSRVGTLAKMDPKMAPDDRTKHYSSAYAKVERDLRHDEQMTMVKNAENADNPLQWISSHADCSERCEKWQGKLVHMTAPPINSRMETGISVDGYKVYSFKGITDQEDKYGYKNNVIVGFNCRHFLIPYEPKSHPPLQYKADTLRSERSITTKQRAMERTIRKLKYQYELLKDTNPKEAKEIRKRWMAMRKTYVEFSQAHKAAYYPWRLY